MLGMLHQGLIWNNEIPTWAKVRGCFQLALNDSNIAKAVRAIKEDTSTLIRANMDKHTCFVDMLGICRRLTFRATLITFFGIDPSDYSVMVRLFSSG